MTIENNNQPCTKTRNGKYCLIPSAKYIIGNNVVYANYNNATQLWDTIVVEPGGILRLQLRFGYLEYPMIQPDMMPKIKLNWSKPIQLNYKVVKKGTQGISLIPFGVSAKTVLKSITIFGHEIAKTPYSLLNTEINEVGVVVKYSFVNDINNIHKNEHITWNISLNVKVIQVTYGPVKIKKEWVIKPFAIKKTSLDPKYFKKSINLRKLIYIWFWKSLSDSVRDKMCKGGIPVNIEGYTSRTDGNDRNFKLSSKRAIAVKKMIKYISGCNKIDFRTTPHGEEQSKGKKEEDPNDRKVVISIMTDEDL